MNCDSFSDSKASSSPAVSRPKPSMFWSEEHDKRLCREILVIDPFSGTRKRTTPRGMKWNEVSNNLTALSYPLFKVDQRAVRERYNLLAQKYRKKMKGEAKASGISPQPTEVEMALENITEIEDEAEEQQTQKATSKRVKDDKDKSIAEDIRRKAMERLGETKRVIDDEGEGKKKKRRSVGQDSLDFIKEKKEMMDQHKQKEMELKKEELEVRKKELELANKKQDTMLQVIQQQQQQQQQQFQNFQAMMLTMITKLTEK